MKYRAFMCTVFCVWLAAFVSASDWPMWGYDEGRSNASGAELSTDLELLWTRELPAPRRAWPFQYEDYYTGGNPQRIGKLSFDVSYEPVAGAGKLFVPSMVSDSVTAYAADTGEELWRYYAGGPVRFAPVYNDGSVYFVSDDGFLYCVSADDGELVWKFKGSFSGRKVLGNERLISIWPARGGPVISGGTVYFASGVLPFEGVFVHAVCADTGNSIWTNSTSGSIWELHQHGGAWSYGGPSPQGYLAVSGDRLIVPGGRTPPAVYDRHTGEFLYFRQATGAVGKGAGGYRAHALGDWFFNHGMLYSLADGAQYGAVPGTVLTEDFFIGASGGRVIAHRSELDETEEEIEDRLQRGAISQRYQLARLWRDTDRSVEEAHFMAGSLLGARTDDGRAVLLKLDADGVAGEPAWEYEIGENIWNMFPADGKLFVVTESGMIYCFGESDGAAPVKHAPEIKEYNSPAGLAGQIISRTAKEEGWALAAGGGIDLAKGLAAATNMNIVALHDDSVQAASARRRADEAGFYGGRVAVLDGSLPELRLPPYFAELIVLAGGECTVDVLESAFYSLRPYGGVMYVLSPGRDFKAVFESAGLQNGVLEQGRGYALVTREGALPGAGQWTHQYAGPYNRTYSDDELVKPPLGVSWFGGPSNLNTLPRHHNGPIPQVAGGRLFILGVDTLGARCVYTGRELWEKEIPGIGYPFTSLSHEEQFESGREVYMPNHPGANFIGSPYVSLEDGVYVIHVDSLMHLDPETGEVLTDFRLPRLDVRRNEWGHVLVWDDYLIAAVDPQYFDDGEPGKTESWNATSSSLVMAMNRHNGRVLWARRAERVGFRHNAIAAGNGRLYLVDGLSEDVVDLLRRRGLEEDMSALLIALDIETGNVLWEDEDAFGTWLGYYAEEDVLIEGGRYGQRGVLPDEPRENLVARRGETGEEIWVQSRRYSGPLGLHRDMIIPGRPGQRVLDPFTGEALRKEHPVTGGEYNWTYHRYYGCGTMNSSRYMLMFRSGAAGFTDLMDFGGTGNFGGFRAGCTNNLVAADGLLNAPDYTRTCTCSYQLQTSLGLAHMPEVEMWTINRVPAGRGAVKTFGVNFGAPGNRRHDGVLWLEEPKIYGRGPDARTSVRGNAEWFRNHSSWIENPEDGRAWVASYGVKGIDGLTVDVGAPDSGEAVYDVTLYFAEPGDGAAGERIFDVSIQGRDVFEGVDIAELAGGPRRVLKMTAAGVSVEGALNIEFSPRPGSLPAALSGVEIIRAD